MITSCRPLQKSETSNVLAIAKSREFTFLAVPPLFLVIPEMAFGSHLDFYLGGF